MPLVLLLLLLGQALLGGMGTCCAEARCRTVLLLETGIGRLIAKDSIVLC
jgi:hypothetical protein